MVLKLMQDQWHTRKEAVHQDLCAKFGKRKPCAEFAPHILLNAQREHSVSTSRPVTLIHTLNCVRDWM